MNSTVLTLPLGRNGLRAGLAIFHSGSPKHCNGEMLKHRPEDTE